MTVRGAAAVIAAALLALFGMVAATHPAKTVDPAGAIPARSVQGRALLTPSQRNEAKAAGSWPRNLKSLLNIDAPLKYGDYRWDDRGIGAGEVVVRVDLRTQLLSVFRGGHEIGTAVILYGGDGKQTPIGTFPILWKARDHRSSLYEAAMPYTMRLTNDGVAIHGSNVRWGAATHGCVGVPTEFAARLFDAVAVDTPVIIVRTDAPRKGAQSAA